MALFTKEFKFEDFIESELGFQKESDDGTKSTFILDEYKIEIYNHKDVKGYDILSMDKNSINIFKMKFIPKSATIAEYLVKQALLIDVR